MEFFQVNLIMLVVAILFFVGGVLLRCENKIYRKGIQNNTQTVLYYYGCTCACNLDYELYCDQRIWFMAIINHHICCDCNCDLNCY